MARAVAYLHAKFHLDPSNRLAATHQRYRRDRQTGQDRQARQRTDSISRTVLQMVAQTRFCAVFSAIVLHSNVLTYRQILQMTPGFVVFLDLFNYGQFLVCFVYLHLYRLVAASLVVNIDPNRKVPLQNVV